MDAAVATLRSGSAGREMRHSASKSAAAPEHSAKRPHHQQQRRAAFRVRGVAHLQRRPFIIATPQLNPRGAQ